MSSHPTQNGVFAHSDRYNSGSIVNTPIKPPNKEISETAKTNMKRLSQSEDVGDHSRLKYLGKLAASGLFKLGGRSTKKINKNKKKYKLRRRYSKKNRK